MNSNDQNLTGKQLGTCVLEKMVGAGGMGMVYLARQTRPARHVAVKLLKPPVGLHSEAYLEFLARFRREADVIAQLDHINILPIYEYGEQDNLAYLVMPYLNGGSLRTLLTERGKFAPKEALTYIEQAASALQYAHEHKIVHRDIKPANMLFHADGRLVLVDFGIARIVHDDTSATEESLTKTGNFMGSVEYMAPEMVEGRNVDYRADIYELGIVLYQMLTGRVPFQGATPFTLAAMHIHNTPTAINELNPALTPDLNAVVQKALAKNPADRYQSVRDFAEAFRASISPSSALQNQDNEGYMYTPWPHTHGLANSTRYSAPGNLGNSSPGNRDVDVPTVNVPPNLQTIPVDVVGQDAPTRLAAQQNNYPQANTPGSYPQQTPLVSQQQPRSVPETPRYISENGTTYDTPYRFSAMSSSSQNQVQGSSKQPQRSVLPWLVAFVAVCVIAVAAFMVVRTMPQLLGNHGPNSSPSPIVHPTSAPTTNPGSTVGATATPAVGPAQQAQAVVQTYYVDINQQNYQDAYQQWAATSNYRQTTTYDQFASGFSNTIHDVVSVSSTSLNSDGTYTVTITLQATENSNNGNVVKNYNGYYTVALIDGQWKLVGGKMEQA
jgi:serine/threonine-protein kinase